jgi:hypothetical protein
MIDNITKRTSHFDININTKTNSILIIQRWKYNWIANGFSEWSYEEKKKMHEAFEKEMVRVWNNRANLKPTGRSAFAKKYSSVSFRLTFDIQWFTSVGHWEVEVKKLAPKDYSHRPNVKWNEQKILLYSVDIDDMLKQKDPFRVTQKNIAHEFGHTLGNISNIPNMHADEYNPKSSFYEDKTSLMNVGMELRTRHFDHIIKEINKMIPDTQFILSI